MSAQEAVEAPLGPSWRFDPAARRRSLRRRRERGCSVYIPAEVLAAAGYSHNEPPPFYRLHGFERSSGSGSVIVSLYREP